eukprot:GILK01002432.1.p1 GENE.GILK01002432.1~~GILK01002432.1.p1  ORF type:complete len:402 (-),score=55.64 GILK01002432.1:116-1294(-)
MANSWTVDETHRITTSILDPPARLLCGPGPSNSHPRVSNAMAMPQVGHLDPFFLNMMDDISEMLRYAWQTNNKFTVAVSGTGSAAMEACFANLVMPGDKVVTCVNGYFGDRMADMASRYGGQVEKITRPYGTTFTVAEIQEALEKHRPAILGIVHGETSTGVLQPHMQEIGDLCRQYNTLLLVDSVTSLGGAPIFVDKWHIDAIYSGSQKTLNCPPGISMLSFSERALEKMNTRPGKVPNWYLDMTAIQKYILGTGEGRTRVYHHTAPINMNYGLREALKILTEEGLENRWKRHREVAQLLYTGLQTLGLELIVGEGDRLPQLTTVRVPEGVDAKAVASHMLNHFNIEIGGGLGELAGKAWRVGMMGYNARPDVVVALLAALKESIVAVKRA